MLAGHSNGITYIDSRGDQRYLISNSKDQSIKLWDVRKCSSHRTEQIARQFVDRQDWDYRWQRMPEMSKYSLKLNKKNDWDIHCFYF